MKKHSLSTKSLMSMMLFFPFFSVIREVFLSSLYTEDCFSVIQKESTKEEMSVMLV